MSYPPNIPPYISEQSKTQHGFKHAKIFVGILEEFITKYAKKSPYSKAALNFMNGLPINDSCWCCGGAVRDILNGEKPKDFDLFFKNAEAYDNAKMWLLRNNAVLVEDKTTSEIFKYNNELVHLVKDYYTSIEEVLNSFDFTICMFGYDKNCLYYGEFSLADLMIKDLCIHALPAPFFTARRLLKFHKKGYNVPDETLEQLLGCAKDSTFY